jgi:hypothetical protein
MTNEKTLLFLLLTALEGLLDQSNQAAQCSKQLSETEAPALDTHSVDEEVHQGPVGHDEDAEDTEVSPCLASFDVQGCKIAVSVLVGAVLAIGGSIRVKKVSTCRSCKCTGVGLTSLATGDVEPGCLAWSTLDTNTVESLRQDTADPPGRGVDVIP